jgi:RNA polymerase sigma-70 factor (ECF subfamily)
LHALVRRSGVPGDTDDHVHDLLSRLITALPQFKPSGPATLTTWVFTIAQRFVIDLSRKRHLQLAPIEAGGQVADERPSAELLLEHAELKVRLEAALQTLPVDQRRCFVLAYVHQRPLAEIAEAEGIPIGTVKSRLHRARAALTTTLSLEKGGAHVAARPDA